MAAGDLPPRIPQFPTSTVGPSSRNRQTFILSPSALSTSHHLRPLASLVNKSFSHSAVHGCPGKEFLPPSGRRLESPQQLVQEIGPDGFCVILLEDEQGGRVIGTASAKPYSHTKEGTVHGNEVNMMFKRQPVAVIATNGTAPTEAPDTDHLASEWEILAMAVDVDMQGQGIAGTLMESTVQEVRTRAAAASAAADDWEGEHSPKIVLMLSTMQELNERYYTKRGWTTTAVRRFEPGTANSRDGFGVAEMVKVL